jgi:predicted enzyme related to lactoylglutathione lyase
MYSEDDMQVFKGINVVSVTVRDLAKAKAFYSDVLGFGKPAYDIPEAGWIEWRTGNDADISITPAEGPFTPSHSTTIVFSVDDCHSAVAELRKRGIRCDDPVGIPGMVTYASFYDPDGNRLQMASAPPAG